MSRSRRARQNLWATVCRPNGFRATHPVFLFVLLTCTFNLSLVRSDFVLELLLKSYENRNNTLLNGESCGGQSFTKPVCSPFFELIIGDELRSSSQSWAFGGNVSGFAGMNLIYFPEFLSNVTKNPLFFLGQSNSSTNLSLDVRIGDGVVERRIAAMRDHLPFPDSIAPIRSDASLLPIKLQANGVSLTAFARWYCAKGWYGKHCESICTVQTCPGASNLTPHTILSKGSATLVTVHDGFLHPSRWNRICPKDPCLVLNVPEAGLIDLEALQSILGLAISLRSVNVWEHLLLPLQKPNAVKTRLELDQIEVPNSRRLVTVAVEAHQGGQPVSHTNIDHALADLEQNKWLPIGSRRDAQGKPVAIQVVAQRFNFALWDTQSTTTIVPFTIRENGGRKKTIRGSNSLIVGGLVTFVILSCGLAILTIYFYWEKRRRDLWIPPPPSNQPAGRHRIRLRHERLAAVFPVGV